MTSERDEDDFRYYYTRGFIGSGSNDRISPSSWDDDTDTEDPTDGNSSSGCLTARNANDDGEGSCHEDRRHSLARVKRRAQVVSDTANEVNEDWDNLLWDMSDDSASLICSKICPPPDVRPERREKPEPVIHSEYFEKKDALGRFDMKLSSILEVEEVSVKSGELTTVPEDRGLTRRVYKSSASSDCRDMKALSEDDSDAGSEGLWRRLRERMKDKEEPTMNHAESDYVNRSLKYIFRDDSAKEESGRDDLGLGNLFEESGRNEYPNPGVPLDGRTSLVTLHDGYGNEAQCLPRSGRESFLIGGRDADSDAFSPKSETCASSKRYATERRLTLSPCDEYTGEVQILHLRQGGQCRRESSEDVNSTSAESTDKTPSDANRRGVENNVDSPKPETERTGDDRQKSASSIESKILLDLDLSDNDDKFSTVDRKAFDDSPQDAENSGNSASPRSILVSGFTENSEEEKQKSSPDEDKLTKTARSPATRSSRLSEVADDYGGKVDKSPTMECCRFGMGDSKWNIGDTTTDGFAPSDWGDAQPDRYHRTRIKSEWRRLMVELEPIENVFWIDVEEFESRRRVLAGAAPEVVKMSDASCQVPESPRPRIRLYARTKPWKRKRSSWTAVSETAESALDDRLVRTRMNWLENGEQSADFLIVPSRRESRSRRGSSSVENSTSNVFGCFRTTFKRFVNALSVTLNRHGK